MTLLKYLHAKVMKVKASVHEDVQEDKKPNEQAWGSYTKFSPEDKAMSWKNHTHKSL